MWYNVGNKAVKMKSKKIKTLGLSMVLSLLLAVPVWAAVDPDTVTSNDEVMTTRARVRDSQAAIKKRIEERKTAASNVRLTPFRERQVRGRCKAAQGQITSLQARLHGAVTARGLAHSKIIDKLDELAGKVTAAGLDTAQLEQVLAELRTQLLAYEEQLTVYQQAIDDLIALECENDPEAFMAALETARSLRSQLADGSAQIKAYLHDTVKAEITVIKTQLAPAAGESE